MISKERKQNKDILCRISNFMQWTIHGGTKMGNTEENVSSAGISYD